jgi:hypothetical protein
VEALALGAQPQGGDERAVEPARQVAADVDLGPQHPQLGGAGQGGADRLGGLAQRTGEVLVVARGPVGALADPAAVVDPDPARRQLADAGEHRARRDRGPKRQGLIEADRIEGPRQVGRAGEDRLDLAAEDHLAVALGVVERPHPDPIASQDQAALGAIPQREGPLAVHPIEGVLAPLLPGVEDDLGVALGAEAVAGGDELRAQLDVVEDLAVEDDPQSLVLVGHRLLAAGQIDDRQAGVGQPGARVAVGPELVGPAVVHRPQHPGQSRGLGSRAVAQRDQTGDATHAAGIVHGGGVRKNLTSSLSRP